jgi:hypothetical protein
LLNIVLKTIKITFEIHQGFYQTSIKKKNNTLSLLYEC